jgi:putative oxidoreductase
MKNKIDIGARLILGLMMTLFGLNFFLHFIPIPPPSEAMGQFLGALINSGFVMQIVKVIEISCGILLLFNMFVPLALILLAPIVVNIFCTHAFLDQQGLPAALFVVILTSLIAWTRWSSFAPLFKAK